jgi:hypothetical protein
MQLKTLIRASASYWALSTEFQRGLAIEDAADRGKPQTTYDEAVDFGIDVTEAEFTDSEPKQMEPGKRSMAMPKVNTEPPAATETKPAETINTQTGEVSAESEEIVGTCNEMPSPGTPRPILPEQEKALIEHGKSFGWSLVEITNYVNDTYGCAVIDLTQDNYNPLLLWIKQHPKVEDVAGSTKPKSVYKDVIDGIAAQETLTDLEAHEKLFWKRFANDLTKSQQDKVTEKYLMRKTQLQAKEKVV